MRGGGALRGVAVEKPDFEVPFRRQNEVSEEIVSCVQQLIEDRVSRLQDDHQLRLAEDRVSGNVVRTPRVDVRVLYVGNFEDEINLKQHAEQARIWLERSYNVKVELSIAEPPFIADHDLLSSRGYWLNPAAKTHEMRRKKLRSQISVSLVALLTEVEKFRPRIIVGDGQGGIVSRQILKDSTIGHHW